MCELLTAPMIPLIVGFVNRIDHNISICREGVVALNSERKEERSYQRA